MLDALVELAAIACCEGQVEQARTIIHTYLAHLALSQSTLKRAKQLLVMLAEKPLETQTIPVRSAEALVAELLTDSNAFQASLASASED